MVTPVAGITHEIVLTDSAGYAIGLRPSTMAGDLDDQLLSFRREPLSRTSIKTASGNQKYSDQQPPYGTLAQDNWIGGRGLESFAEDPTKFADSMQLWTLTENQAILGPKAQAILWGTNNPDHNPGGTIVPMSVTYSAPGNGTETLDGKAVAFITTTACTVTTAQVYVRLSSLYMVEGEGGQPGNWYDPYYILRIYTNSTDKPGTVVASSAPFLASSIATSYGYLSKAISASLAEATVFWLALESVTDAGSKLIPGASTVQWATKDYDVAQAYPCADWSGTAWSTTGLTEQRAWFKINTGGGSIGQPIGGIFDYMGALYAYTTPATGAAKLLLNGDRGVATGAQSSTTLKDTTKTWTVNEWAGCIVKIVGGTGIDQYRAVASNTADTLTVTAWDVNPTAGASGSEYVLLGSDKWVEVMAGEFTGPITSVCGGFGNTLYFAMGRSANVKRMRWRNVAGVATYEDAADSSVKAMLIAKVGRTIYWYYFDAAGDYSVMFETDNRVWSVDNLQPHMIGGGGRNITPQDGKITSFTAFNGATIMTTARGMYAIQNDMSFAPIDVEYGSHADDHNGVNTQWNGMFYFALGYGLERMVSKQVDDIGPNRGQGMPSGRQGHIVAFCPTLDGLFCALNAGTNGTSAVLVYNNFGWHELVRAAVANSQITALFYQSIPDGPNRLWYGEGQTLMYVEMPDKTSNPYKDSRITYNASGELITPWIDGGLSEASKFFHEFTIVADNLSAASCYINVYYQIDNAADADAWTAIAGNFDTSPSETISLTTGDTVVAKRIRFKLVFTSLTDSQTPRLKAWAVEYVARLQPKFSYAFNAGLPRGPEGLTLMSGDSEELDIATILAKLDEWSAPTAAPLTLTSVVATANNKKVFLDPVRFSIRNTAEDDATGGKTPSKYVLQLSLIEA